jgi:prevent-host-death family protein
MNSEQQGIGLFEAKTKLSELIERVERGEEITITRRGVPVAKLIPATRQSRRDPEEVMKEVFAIRKRVRLPKGVTIRQLRDEGRRY